MHTLQAKLDVCIFSKCEQHMHRKLRSEMYACTTCIPEHANHLVLYLLILVNSNMQLLLRLGLLLLGSVQRTLQKWDLLCLLRQLCHLS